MTDQVLAYLADKSAGRFFVWIHFFAPHEPYVDHDAVLSFGA